MSEKESIPVKICGWLFFIAQIIYWYMEALYRQFVPPPMKSINGETVLVTGAAGGIGKEICQHLVQSAQEITLILWDMNMAELKKLKENLETTNVNAKVHLFDVDISRKDTIQEYSKKIKEMIGPVSIIFNNAGIGPPGNFLQLSDEQIEKVFEVNLMSHMWIIREFLPEMVLSNHGRIVNICSMAGFKASALGFPYYSTKFAVNGYTESLKLELQTFQHTGVHVTTVYPYFVQTKLIRSLEITPHIKNSMRKAYHQVFDAAYVGRKIVEGMRRELEYIYFPSIMPLDLALDYLCPLKLRKAMTANFMPSVVYKDVNDQKLCISYVETIRTKQLQQEN